MNRIMKISNYGSRNTSDTPGQPNRKIVIDLNKYLIENHPSLSLKQRNSIGAICEKATNIELKSVYKQIDKYVKDFIKNV